MTIITIKDELQNRIDAFTGNLAAFDPAFNTAVIAGRVNQYYFTGTMQDGLLILKKDCAFYFVRKSYERAKCECPLDIVMPMTSYRDISAVLSPEFGVTYIDADVIPVSMLDRLKKYFKMSVINGLDRLAFVRRAVKSERELSIMIQAGLRHRRLLEEEVPALLKEGISEAEFQSALFGAMVKSGYQGVTRFSAFQAEVVTGQFGFGENAAYPTCFDGPGGMKGMGAASPSFGSRERKLKIGDIVFVDFGFGLDGYHTDKTQVYSFGAAPDPEIIKIHRACMDVEKQCAEMSAAGAVPSDIYRKITGKLPDTLSRGFMGGENVKFLGHGIGLQIDEWPVVASGFDDPLSEGMTIAFEPKCRIPGVGTVGVEDTYIVRSDGGECITGGGREIMII